MHKPDKLKPQARTVLSREGKKRKANWRTTNCPFCKRMRLYVVWTILMFLVYFYVFQR
jgi:hypothetical protein